MENFTEQTINAENNSTGNHDEFCFCEYCSCLEVKNLVTGDVFGMSLFKLGDLLWRTLEYKSEFDKTRLKRLLKKASQNKQPSIEDTVDDGYLIYHILKECELYKIES